MSHRALAFLAIPIVLVALTAQAVAFEECESSADCVEGFVCEVVGIGGCPEIICPPGEDCPEVPPCDEETFSACVPGPCETDADCGEGLACIAVGYDDCAVTVLPCEEGEDCPEPWFDEECEEVVENYCLPSYVLPCEAASDCGEGFECIAVEQCACSGSDGDGDEPPLPGDPEDDDPRSDGDDDDCVCTPSDESYCVPREVECAAHADCPEGWTCEAGPTTGACSFDPETGEEICDEPEVGQSYCFPPLWDYGWYGGSDFDGDDMGALEAITGSDNARPTGPSRSLDSDDVASGCSAAPGAPGGAMALAWLLPLLVSRLRRRSL
jgi:hypothetical protein